MSFILDALKKSESERLRKDTPGIASIPQGSRHKSSSRWIWLVIVLVTVNLVVLAGLLYKADLSSAPDMQTALPVMHEADPPAPQDAAVASAETDSLPPAAGRDPGDILVARPTAQPAALTPNPAPAQVGTVNDGLETFNDLRAKGDLNLPDMHLDIHVFSGQPADRFVFVNMAKYKENARLKEGPVVAEITPDGVVLDYQGTMFLLPRE